MTRRTNARLAGFMFLFYIATAFPEMVLFARASGGQTAAARLASIAQHAPLVRATAVLVFVTFVDAVVLAVALYGLTRDEDHDLATLALSCRVSEGVINAIAAIRKMGLLSVAMASTAAAAPDAAAPQALGALLLKEGSASTLVGATCFAIGSTVFAYLFLRARSIPVWLAWVGVLGSALLVVALPAQLAGVLRGPITDLIWIPVAVFEIVLGFWLLIKGARTPATSARRTG
jgi:hypothetical protein